MTHDVSNMNERNGMHTKRQQQEQLPICITNRAFNPRREYEKFHFEATTATFDYYNYRFCGTDLFLQTFFQDRPGQNVSSRRTIGDCRARFVQARCLHLTQPTVSNI